MDPLLYLLLPALASCSITIRLHAVNESDFAFIFKGYDAQIINKNDKLLFHIFDEKYVRNAAKKHTGVEPEFIYFHSPTPYNDLYKVNGWPEVTRTVMPIGYETFGLETKIMQLDSTNFESVTPKLELASKKVYLEDYVKVKWSVPEGLDVNEAIVYSIDINPEFQISSSWRTNFEKVRRTVISYGDVVNVYPEKGKIAKSSLIVTEVFMRASIKYGVTLNGALACKYADMFRGRYFWNLDIVEVLKAGGYPIKVVLKQMVEFKFHTDGKVVVSDNSTDAKIVVYDADIREL